MKSKMLMFAMWIFFFPYAVVSEWLLTYEWPWVVYLSIAGISGQAIAFSLFGILQIKSLDSEINRPIAFGTPNYPIVKASKELMRSFVWLYWLAILMTSIMAFYFNLVVVETLKANGY